MPEETGDPPMADDDPAAAGQAPECQFCPFCAGLAALREARPEAVEHLVKAGAELLLAARALLDGAAEPADRPAPGRRPRPRRAAPGDAALARDGLQRIDVG
jgi:hypothetical protein